LERKEKRDKFGMIIIMDKVTETDWTWWDKRGID
jgi:hypothetical protein